MLPGPQSGTGAGAHIAEPPEGIPPPHHRLAATFAEAVFPVPMLLVGLPSVAVIVTTPARTAAEQSLTVDAVSWLKSVRLILPKESAT
jgi:hypothetical protein